MKLAQSLPNSKNVCRKKTDEAKDNFVFNNKFGQLTSLSNLYSIRSRTARFDSIFFVRNREKICNHLCFYAFAI